MGVMKRKIPAEITSFKEKFFFGLTVRQLICGAGIWPYPQEYSEVNFSRRILLDGSF